MSFVVGRIMKRTLAVGLSVLLALLGASMLLSAGAAGLFMMGPPVEAMRWRPPTGMDLLWRVLLLVLVAAGGVFALWGAFRLARRGWSSSGRAEPGVAADRGAR